MAPLNLSAMTTKTIMLVMKMTHHGKVASLLVIESSRTMLRAPMMAPLNLSTLMMLVMTKLIIMMKMTHHGKVATLLVTESSRTTLRAPTLAQPNLSTVMMLVM